MLKLASYKFPIVVDLAGLEAAPGVQLLANHENSTSSLIGRVDRVVNNGNELVVQGEIVPVTQAAKEIVAASDRGIRWQTSIGCSPSRIEEIPVGREVQVNGQTFRGPLLVARSAVLREVSITPMGVDPETYVSIAASMPQQVVKGAAMSFEEYVKSLGLDPATLPEAAKAVLMEKHAAMSAAVATEEPPMPAAAGGVGNSPNPTQASLTNPNFKLPDVAAAAVADFRASLAKDMERASQINKVCVKHPDIAAKAISEGWTVEKAENMVLKAGRIDGAPAGHVYSQDHSPEVIEAAICMKHGLNRIEAHYKEPILEKAARQFKGMIGPKQLLHICAKQGGFDGFIDSSNISDALKAAYSTASLPGILSNTANKFLLQGFEAVEDGWERISAVTSVNDFKAHTRYRLIDGGKFEQLAPTGELKHGTVSEESYTIAADTYGKMYAINRQMIINDDLSALSEMPRRIGRQGALKLLDVFWTEFFANHATFFNTDNSKQNYLGTSASALGINSLTSAEALFFNKVDPSGNPLAVDPAVLLVPNALFVTATQLMTDLEARNTTSSTKETTGNPHRGKFDVVRSSYLSNASYGNSTTAWYLLARPSDLPMIDVAFLNGQRTPTVESADADFSTLGIQMRGYFDFGVAKQDYRAAVKNVGA